MKWVANACFVFLSVEHVMPKVSVRHRLNIPSTDPKL